ncbi:hypothetical protein [Paenibacillus sp. BJ-4]|uniref:hypothetical protein n=1 Tax=Paenibacillus sp. BJ-4 TaxID=2878097 RepID=UPI001CF02777|nr:hypothetical protein [Paenibacillus sp. BJ-4]
MENLTDLELKEHLIETMRNKANNDKDFFSKLANDPDQIVQELNITHPALRQNILSLNPDKILNGLTGISVESCTILTTVVGSCS